MFGAMLITTKSSEMTLQFCRGLHICIHATKLQVIRTLQTEVLEDGQRNVTEIERNSPYALIATAADEQIGEESHSSKKKHVQHQIQEQQTNKKNGRAKFDISAWLHPANPSNQSVEELSR